MYIQIKFMGIKKLNIRMELIPLHILYVDFIRNALNLHAFPYRFTINIFPNNHI